MSNAPSDPTHWQRLSDLFERALESTGDDREALLLALPEADADLIAELRAMLAADDAAAALDGRVPLPAGVKAPLPPHAAGTVLGVWQLDGILGQGGMGVVHAAHRIDDFAQRAAVKCLQQRWDGKLQEQRFLRERDILAGLSHPHIARLLDAGIDEDGQPWFAMEHIDGHPIDVDADARRLSLRDRIRLILRVCAAVQHAHERFVVHRDLKPDNLLVDGDGNPKVLDFGVAKLLEADAGQVTRTGLPAAFTPDYAAPEQIDGSEITTATDVHALGLVLYRLLTGGMPYSLEGRSLPERIAAISRKPPMRPEHALTTGDNATLQKRLHDRDTSAHAFRRFVSGDLTRILQTALAKEPQRRYANVQAFASDLQRFLDGRPVSVSGDTTTYRLRKFVQRNPWSSALAASLLSTAIGFGVYATITSKRIAAHVEEVSAQRDRAQAIADFLGKLFSQTDPMRSSGELTASEILAAGESQLEQDQDLPAAERAAVLTAIGGVRQVRGEYPLAVAALTRAVALERESGPAGRPLANSLLELSKVKTRMGQYAEAEVDAREALAVLDGLPRDPAERASALNQIAMAVSYTDRNAETAELLEQVVALRRDLPGEENARNLVPNYNNLALAYLELERLDDADHAYASALALLQKGDDSEHPYVALVLGGRAAIHEQRGDLAKARSDLDQALVIGKKRLGEDHPFVADVHFRLGRVMARQGEPASARGHLQRALHLQRQSLPAGHDDIRQTETLLATLPVPAA